MLLQAEEEAEQLKWVYVRVKRAKATYFLHVDLQQTAFEVKAMLQDLTQRVRCCACVACRSGAASCCSGAALSGTGADAQDPGDMKLWREGVELQDACKLADAQVENDDVLALAFRLKGEVAAAEEAVSRLARAVLTLTRAQETQARLASGVRLREGACVWACRLGQLRGSQHRLA